MRLKSRWAIVAGTVLVAGSLLAGAAFAAGGAGSAAERATRLEQAVRDGKLTQGEADVAKKLGELRDTYMAKLKADSKAVVDQAVKDGKITQERADRMQAHKAEGGRGHGWKQRDGAKHPFKGMTEPKPQTSN